MLPAAPPCIHALVALCPGLQVGGAIETAKPEAPVDVMMGIGGTPEVSWWAGKLVRVRRWPRQKLSKQNPCIQAVCSAAQPFVVCWCWIDCCVYFQGVIAAAALKCMGGHIQGRLWPRDEADAAAIKASGRDPARILYTDDLVRGNDVSCLVSDTRVFLRSIMSGSMKRPAGWANLWP